MRTVITYGSYDLFHQGHLRLLERAKQLGDVLIVGLSTDKFATVKGKAHVQSYKEREATLEATGLVDLVIPENDWQQEVDIKRWLVNTFVMGSDWENKFDHLKEHCKVVYLPRTEGVSTTKLKKKLGI